MRQVPGQTPSKPRENQISGHALNSLQALIEGQLKVLVNSESDESYLDGLFQEAREAIGQAESENSELKQRIEASEKQLTAEERKNAQWAYELDQIEFYIAQRPDTPEWQTHIDGESTRLAQIVSKLREIIAATLPGDVN